MTRQDVVDGLHDWYVVGENPPSIINAVCRYRQYPDDVTSLRCSVGLFIPDELYQDCFDLDGHKGLIKSLLKSKDLMNKELKHVLHISDIKTNHGPAMLKFWGQVQRCHDLAAVSPNFLEKFSILLRIFVEAENLVYPGDKL